MVNLSAASCFWFSLNSSYDRLPPIETIRYNPGKQQSATMRDVQAPKRKEMRSTTVGGEGLGVRHGPVGCRIASCRPLIVPPSCPLFALAASLLSYCLSLSSRCALLSSSCRAGWLLRRLLTRRPLIVSLSRCASLSSSRCASWLSYHLLSSSLVGIDIIRTPDLGQGGAHAGGVALQQEEVHLCHTRSQSPPPRSRYRQQKPAFHCCRVTVAHSVAIALPSRRRSLSTLPSPRPLPAAAAMCAAC